MVDAAGDQSLKEDIAKSNDTLSEHRDGRVFWSNDYGTGADGKFHRWNKERADAAAKDGTGKYTELDRLLPFIDELDTGKYQGKEISPGAQQAAEAELSLDYAKMARGTVVIYANNTGATSYFRKTEMPVLMDNQDVRHVTYVDTAGTSHTVPKAEWYNTQRQQWVDARISKLQQSGDKWEQDTLAWEKGGQQGKAPAAYDVNDYAHEMSNSYADLADPKPLSYIDPAREQHYLTQMKEELARHPDPDFRSRMMEKVRADLKDNPAALALVEKDYPAFSSLMTVGAGKPDELRAMLAPGSDFYQSKAAQAAGLTPGSPVVAKLLKLTEGGVTVYPHNFHVHTAEESGLTMADLRSLGALNEKFSLMVTVKDSHGKPEQLVPSEFIAWQGIGGKSMATAYPDLPIDVFAAKNGVTIQNTGPGIDVAGGIDRDGGQHYDLESDIGSKRLVAVGRVVAGPYAWAYGSENIRDTDPKSASYGHPINVGDGALDIYAPPEVVKQVKSGQPYYGPVSIKLRVENDGMNSDALVRPDPKVFLSPDPHAAILAESANWQSTNPDGTVVKEVEVSHLAGVTFDPPVTLKEGVVKDYANHQSSFVSMSGAQYQAWKYALGEHSELRGEAPDTWIRQTYGSRENFDAVFKNYPDGQPLTREHYHHTIAEGAKLEVKEVSALLRDTGNVTAVETFLHGKDGTHDGKLTADEMTGTLNKVQLKGLSAEGMAELETLRTALAASAVSHTQAEAALSIPAHRPATTGRGVH